MFGTGPEPESFDVPPAAHAREQASEMPPDEEPVKEPASTEDK
jgi:hypothetical protein